MDPMYDKFMRANDVRKNNDQERKNKLAEKSKENLSKIIQTKFRTTFIGALSCFEEVFGYLWGYDKKNTELTQEERDLKDKWLEIRTKILNNGNAQSRAVLNELKQYRIMWQGYMLRMKGKINES